MRWPWLVSVVGGAVLAIPGPGSALTPQEVALRTKPAVVLVTARVDAEVTLDCRSMPVLVRPTPFVEIGTGWFIDGHGWVVTNAHVVDPAHRLPPWVVQEIKKTAVEQGCVAPTLRARRSPGRPDPAREEQVRREVFDRALAGARVEAKRQVTVQLSSGVKLPAEVKKFSPPLLTLASGEASPDSGRDLALLRVPEGVYPALPVSNRPPRTGDVVHVIGYPAVVQFHELLSTSIDASVTSGTVSSVDKRDAIGQDLIQTDAPAAHGNSGGPAVGDDATVLGVLTFVSLSAGGAVVQGYNFLVPARDVLRFVEGTPVTKPGQSRFNDAWLAGVAAFFKGRDAAALPRFAEADKLQPGLPDVRRAIQDAGFRIKNPPPRPVLLWAAIGVTLLSAGGYGGMWVRRWWRNRFRVTPAQVIAFIEHGLDPILLDVRTGHDYETSPLRLPGALRLEPEAITADGPLGIPAEPGQIVVAYDTSPDEATSQRVVPVLRRRGLDARIMKGGLGGWTNARLPVEAKSSLPSIGLEIYRNLTLGDIERRRFETDQPIMVEGDDAHGEAFVIHSGRAEVRRTFDGVVRVLAMFGEGDLVGEMALFRGAPRSATVVATAPTEVLVIKQERLDWLIRNRPQLTMELLKKLSEMVVATDEYRGPRGEAHQDPPHDGPG